jgi:tetratricopeptide (TPR) repeat protein
MAEGVEGGHAAPDQDAAALGMALAEAQHNPAVAQEANAFLREQTRLAHEQLLLVRLQAADLRREDKLRHWSLRVHHVSDIMKLAFELALAFILVAVATGVGAAIWTAAHDKSLIIDAFQVPPDLASRGLSGQVIASRVEDRLAWMQAHTATARVASTYHHNWDEDDLKVQIPDTGISIGEFYRYLVGWLGSQTHISGEIWHARSGIVLTTRVGSAPAPSLAGNQDDLDTLIVKAAEQIYRQTQPYRYIAWLDRENRIPEELSAARTLATTGPTEEKPWAYTRWGVTLESLGDLRGALEKQRLAVTLGPQLPHAWYNLGAAEAVLGHDEAALRDNTRAFALMQSPAAHQLAPFAVAATTSILKMLIAEAGGDYRAAIAEVPHVESLAEFGAAHQSAAIMKSADLAASHDVAASKIFEGKSDAELVGLQMGANGNFDVQPLPALQRAVALDDWKAARDDLVRDNRDRTVAEVDRALLPVLTWPWLAYAHARLGDFAAAQALIDRTPLDCYLCLRMRGNIRAAEGKWDAAAYWLARATAEGPSLPFAWLDWGRMLLAKGDADGAIARFEVAHRLAPRFADPLEMWGEALMAKNRSDLALAKFEDGNRYAPNWGRLHLKWGEALWWSGDPGQARHQFATAAHLDLASTEKSELARMSAARH